MMRGFTAAVLIGFAWFLLVSWVDLRAQPAQLPPLPKPAAAPDKSVESPQPPNGTGDPAAPEIEEATAEVEDRLVVLPEIKREGERFYLSSFKLPDKLTFAGRHSGKREPKPVDRHRAG